MSVAKQIPLCSAATVPELVRLTLRLAPGEMRTFDLIYVRPCGTTSLYGQLHPGAPTITQQTFPEHRWELVDTSTGDTVQSLTIGTEKIQQFVIGTALPAQGNSIAGGQSVALQQDPPPDEQTAHASDEEAHASM